MSRGILKALAYETDDIVHVDGVFDGVIDVDSSEDDFANKRNQNRKIAMQIRGVVEEKESKEFWKTRLRWM